MPNVITAGNSSNGGTAISTDTSGTLNIVTGSGSGANAITIDASQNVAMSAGQTVAGNLTVTGSITGGSISVANSLRAWINFNGTGTPSIRASNNISSITDNGTGDYTLNFTTAMTDANYSFVGTAAGQSGSRSYHIVSPDTVTAITASLIRFVVINVASTKEDENFIFAAIFR